MLEAAKLADSDEAMDQITAEGLSLEDLTGLTSAEIAELLHNAREVLEQYHAEVKLGLIKKIVKEPNDFKEASGKEFIPGDAPEKEVAANKFGSK